MALAQPDPIVEHRTKTDADIRLLEPGPDLGPASSSNYEKYRAIRDEDWTARVHAQCMTEPAHAPSRSEECRT